MTKKLQPFKGHKNLFWGIQRRIVDIEVAHKLYLQLLQTNQFEIDEPLSIGEVQLLQEQYVLPREDMHHEVQLNNILKNNFKNGSYILEFFDEVKNKVQFLLDNPPLLNQFSEEISSILPIKVGTVSDRLGNIIFQFPINNFELYHDRITVKNKQWVQKYQGIKLAIISKSKTFNIQNLVARLYEEDTDKLITRQRFINIDSTVTDIAFDDCFGTHIEIIDKTTSLLLYKYKFSIIKQMYSNISVIEPQNRVFKIDGNIHKIKVSTNASRSIYGKEKNKSFDEWIRNRKYEQELKELEKSKAFVQYFGNEKKYILLNKIKWSISNNKNILDYKSYKKQQGLIASSITKAMKDVREIINKHGNEGVYLWDPYLNAKDIKNTLYFCQHTYVPMRAITSFSEIQLQRNISCPKCGEPLESKNTTEKAKTNMTKELECDDEKFLFMNLEVRGKIKQYGYKFHDRFLIFPLEQPKVWSLGISVNQIGASHQILQEVKNAQHILNAFNKLWDELNHEECLVWKSK